MKQKFLVYGEIVIPVYFPTYDTSREAAFQRVQSLLNAQLINLIDGDISTTSGKTYPLIASKCRVKWIDTVDEDNVI